MSGGGDLATAVWSQGASPRTGRWPGAVRAQDKNLCHISLSSLRLAEEAVLMSVHQPREEPGLHWWGPEPCSRKGLTGRENPPTVICPRSQEDNWEWNLEPGLQKMGQHLCRTWVQFWEEWIRSLDSYPGSAGFSLDLNPYGQQGQQFWRGFFFKYLFIWLHRVSVAALRTSVASCRVFCCGSDSFVWFSDSRAHGLSSCVVWAQLLCSMWNLSSLTKDRTCASYLAKTTGPPGKSQRWQVGF